MGAPDARERALVAEERMELAALAGQDRGERLRVDLERVRPEVSEVFVQLSRADDPDARALLLACLGEDELAAVHETQLEHRSRGAFLPGRDVAKAPGAHQVDAQHELAVLGREHEVLPPALGGREPPALEGIGPRIERLERRNVAGPRRLDGRTRHVGLELAHPGLDLGQLRHGPSVLRAPPPAAGALWTNRHGTGTRSPLTKNGV